MSKKMLIDASHAEEMRVVIMNKNYLEEFECETSTKKPIKGNIYLARVMRVEPSLQAAFLDFGSDRHGFLSFNEIHPDYYRIPAEDQKKLLESLSEESKAEGDEPEDVELSEAPKSRFKSKATRSYKIQDVIKKRQVILVQVIKDERGAKGAALTTYLSLPGRYCVLMPNTPRGGGISRKITDTTDRKRLKEMMGTFDVEEGAGLILRTAGMGRTKLEIKRDYDYLTRVWHGVRDKTIVSEAPSLIYEEGNLVTKAIRDLYTKEIDEVLVEGEESYKEAKNLMRILTPSHAKKVQIYKDARVPLFHKYGVEGKIDSIQQPVVHLPSGGYLVINPTEALVSIDVNSGKATRERHIEETALKTNLEAAEEIARQLRLRDLAGLIVIDFIDMDQSKNNTQVERVFRDALKTDRARIQVGSISVFGLLEMSRQRLRPSLAETISMPCSHCQGAGIVRSVESSSLLVLRALEAEGIKGNFGEIIVYLPTSIAFYLLNQKRSHVWNLEKKYDVRIMVARDDTLIQPSFRIEPVRTSERASPIPQSSDLDDQEPLIVDIEHLTEEATETESSSTEEKTGGLSRSARRRRRKRAHKQNPDSSPLPQPLAEESELPESHLSLVVSDASEEENTSSDNPPKSSEDSRPGSIRRHGRHRTPKVRSVETDMKTSEALVLVEPSEEEEPGLNKRGATRLKTGRGSARHFGRTYAKLAKDRIKRPDSEETLSMENTALAVDFSVTYEGEEHFVAPSAEQPRTLSEVKSLRKRASRSSASSSTEQTSETPSRTQPRDTKPLSAPRKKKNLQEENTSAISENSSLSEKQDEVSPSHVKKLSRTKKSTQETVNTPTPSQKKNPEEYNENPHVQAAQKKGWWKRLLDS